MLAMASKDNSLQCHVGACADVLNSRQRPVNPAQHAAAEDLTSSVS